MTIENTLPSRTILTVTQLNQQARGCLESNFMSVWVKGEVSNFSAPTSGHWYFTLKDNGAQIKAAMFRAKNSRLKFTPQHGDEVIVRGRVSLYEGRGDYQLLVDDIEPVGAGKLQLAFEQLKNKMREKGWFDEERKKPLPEKPSHVAIITSPTGAALQDMLSVAQRRYPLMRITVLPAAVQGDLAAPELANQLRNAQGIDADLIIIGRGGGSLEDLWAFNEPQVARAIIDSTVPVISAVGHETDFSISDFVADLRAPTPSAAIELATPDIADMHRSLVASAKQLLSLQRGRLERLGQQVDIAASRLKHPSVQLNTQRAQLEALSQKLVNHAERVMANRLQRFTRVSSALNQHSPDKQIVLARARLSALASKPLATIEQQLSTKRQALGQAGALLQANSPLQTFARGYSMATNTKGELVRSSEQIKKGEIVDLRFSDGGAKAEIIETSPK